MALPLNPSLYEINTRVWLRELSSAAGHSLTLAQVPDAELDRLAAYCWDWIWLLGVWQTGPAGQQISRTNPDLRRECEAALPDLTDDDICGSPFAICGYTVHTDFGGNEALALLRARLQQRGMRLMLDFVPNHTALDHPWTQSHPEYYIRGTDEDLAKHPENFCRIVSNGRSIVVGHGRDPYFSGWSDTLQLNYRDAGCRAAMAAELSTVAGQCDGVRCDTAMLLLPDVIARTWGALSLPADGSPPVDAPFWPEATRNVHGQHPQFTFMAEVYWDLEWVLQQQGFNYTYDKRLYDRLHAGSAEAVRGHLHAAADYQHRSVRFLENQDEARAAAYFPGDFEFAAATITYLVTGLRFFHDGQFEGRRVELPVHLDRRPDEPIDERIRVFYERLLQILRCDTVRDGEWRLVDCREAWAGNPTWQNFVTFSWTGATASRLLVAVNFGATEAQCFVELPFGELASRRWILQDLLSPARYERDGNDLLARGLYLDMPAWGHQVLELTAV